MYLFTCKNCGKSKYSGELTMEETGRITRADNYNSLLISCECRNGSLSVFFGDIEKQEIEEKIHALESELISLNKSRVHPYLIKKAEEQGKERDAYRANLFKEQSSLRNHSEKEDLRATIKDMKAMSRRGFTMVQVNRKNKKPN